MTIRRPVCSALHQTRLTVERLEQRELMAGDVSATLQGQMLVIVGDTQDNGVVVTYSSASQTFRVSGHDAGGSGTTINGLDTSQAANVVEFSGVKQFYIGLGDGNDDLEVGSPAAVDTVIQKWLTIEMGSGDDDVTLGVSGNATGGAPPVAQSLSVGTSLNVDLGAGHDHLSLANANIGYALNVLAGDGDDHVNFDTEFTPAGATRPTLFPVQVRGNALISQGGGADELTLRNASIQGSLTVLDGAGAAQISLYNVSAKKRVNVHTGDDIDQIDIRLVRAKQLNITTNGSADNVVMYNTAFTTLNIKLGAARDYLRINRTRTSLGAHLDGEGSGSRLVGANNGLHGLWRRHLG